MKKNEITEFFANIENTNDFTIRKWIYEQTNNLDIGQFCALSMEFKNYCRSRVFKEQILSKKNDVFSKIFDKIEKNDIDFFEILPVKYYAFENGKIQQKVGFIKPTPRFNFNCKYLYYEFLCFQNIMHEIYTSKIPPQQIPSEQEESIGNKISINQIALKCFYEGKIITRENAKEQLINTGYKSGDKLYNVFSKWSNTADRKADPESKVKLNNKIELFKSVIELLPEEKKRMANDDLKILSSFISKY